MQYYKEFFGIAYPFSKYDQVYVPEFNSAAMENVRLVTYNEGYIPRSKTCTKA
jgi:aminopeptidase N